MALPGQNLVVGQQPFQLPNPDDGQSTLVLNQDTTFSIDLAPDDTFSFTQTYTLDPQEGINWPQGGPLWCRISKGQTANGVIVWVQPGGTVAPPHAISVSGGVNAQALQGYPISATPPGNKQGLVWDATSGSWIPANLVNSISAGTGIAVSGNTGDVSVSNSGVTSIVAGSGISINQSTGQVTINSTATGGVSNINNQTGAIVFFPWVISTIAQYALPTSLTEIMNNASSIPQPYSQGSYLFSGFLYVTANDNPTVSITVVDGSGSRHTYYCYVNNNNTSLTPLNAPSLQPGGYQITPMGIYQAPTGVGDRVIVNGWSGAANRSILSAQLIQLSDS